MHHHTAPTSAGTALSIIVDMLWENFEDCSEPPDAERCAGAAASGDMKPDKQKRVCLEARLRTFLDALV